MIGADSLVFVTASYCFDTCARPLLFSDKTPFLSGKLADDLKKPRVFLRKYSRLPASAGAVVILGCRENMPACFAGMS